MKNALLDMRLDKSSDDFIKILRITQNDLANKSTDKLVKIYKDLLDVYDNEPAPFSNNQMRIINAIKDLGSDVWSTLTLRKYNMANLVDCVGDVEILHNHIMRHISDSKDIDATLRRTGLAAAPDDVGSLFISESDDGDIIHLFSIFENIAYMSESLTALVINGECTYNYNFYFQEQSENVQKIIEDTFERSNEHYEQ